MGMVRDNRKGKLIVKFNIIFPDRLESEKVDLLKDILP